MNMKGWWLLLAGGLLTFALLAWVVTLMFPAREPAPVDPSAPAVTDGTDAGAAPIDTPTGTDAAHITATLFFASADGQALVPVRRDVNLAGSVVDQGRELLMAQLTEAPPPPYASVIPPGTTLRAFYLTDRGDAFVDLSAEVSTGHPGGSSNELLTVYALVSAVTANLPAARRVQILVEGQEVDTIAGHVDLRRPLAQDPSLVREP